MNIFETIKNAERHTINSIDCSYVDTYGLGDETRFVHQGAGSEHYKLLMYISTLYNNQILFDVGTYKCMSAMSLSYSKNNKIKSYDIEQYLEKNPIIDNVTYFLGDSTEDQDLKNTPFIFLDVFHDGVYENKFYNHLKTINWKGILLLDDIHLNPDMKNFWSNINEEKCDISNIGHWSGTGIVNFL